MKNKTGYPSKDKIHLEGIPEEKLNPKIQPYSMFAIFSQINEGKMEEIALEANGKTWKKGEIAAQAMMFADTLLNFGLTPGDEIAIALPNCFEGVVMTLGANAIGVHVFYLDPAITIDDLYDFVNEHDVKFVFDDVGLFHNIMQKNKIEFHTDVDKVDRPLERTVTVIKEHLLNDDIAIYLQTSGSTAGKPKTLPFKNSAIFASLIYIANSTGTKTNDEAVSSVLCIIPYRLPYGWMTIFINLIAGNKVILAPGASPEDIGGYYKLKPSYIYGTPVIFQTFMEQTPQDADLSSITAFFCSGFSIPEEWYQNGRKYFEKHNSGAEIRNNYGIGEGLCIGTASDGIEHKPGTCGKFYIGPEWLLVDDDGNEVKYGEIGEAIVAAKSLCEGYYGDRKKTEEAFFWRNGKVFYRTGDYMKLAEDGYVTFVGRKKRFYQPKGATDKVNCETIEKALMKSPLVKKCAVVIGKGKDGFDTSFAFVELKNKSVACNITASYLYNFLKDELLDYQKPHKIIFIDEIPMMKSGKPDYPKLQKMLP